MRKFAFYFFGLIAFMLFYTPGVFSQKSVFDGFEDYDKSATVKKVNRKLDANDVAGALKILDKAIEKKEDLFEVYRKRAFIRQIYTNDIDGAIADLNLALEIKPDDVDIYISRAYLKKRFKKDYIGALKDYEEAQKFKTKSLILIKLKYFLKLELEDYDGAITELETGLKMYSEDIDLHIGLSNVLTLKNESDKAILHLQTFLDDYLKKRNGELPKIKGEKVKKKIPSNLQNFEGAENPVPVKRYSQMEFSISSFKDYQKQLTEIEDARRLSNAFITLGRSYIAKNEFEKAFVNLNNALTIDKNQEQAYALRGVIYLSSGEYVKAIDEFNSAIEITDDPTFYLNRGISYLFVGNDKKSQKDFDKFVEIFPAGKLILDQKIDEAKKILTVNSAKPR